MTGTGTLPALARRYVELSNRHDLAALAALFASDARYRSSSVGSFEGRPAILEMMQAFFAKFPDVHWQVDDYRRHGDDSVVFSFAMTATEQASGTGIRREGIETIAFAPDGRVRDVEVQVASETGSVSG